MVVAGTSWDDPENSALRMGVGYNKSHSSGSPTRGKSTASGPDAETIKVLALITKVYTNAQKQVTKQGGSAVYLHPSMLFSKKELLHRVTRGQIESALASLPMFNAADGATQTPAVIFKSIRAVNGTVSVQQFLDVCDPLAKAHEWNSMVRFQSNSA